MSLLPTRTSVVVSNRLPRPPYKGTAQVGPHPVQFFFELNRFLSCEKNCEALKLRKKYIKLCQVALMRTLARKPARSRNPADVKLGLHIPVIRYHHRVVFVCTCTAPTSQYRVAIHRHRALPELIYQPRISPKLMSRPTSAATPDALFNWAPIRFNFFWN